MYALHMCSSDRIDVDRESLLSALAEYERLRARISEAVGEYDAAGLWELDGATSMRAWLEGQAGMSTKAAGAMVRLASRLRRLPVTATAWADGAISGGQVEAVVANVP